MRIMAATLFAIGATSAAFAHHGFTGRYDRTRPVWIEGVVTQARFALPHARLVVRTDVETPPSNAPRVQGQNAPTVAASGDSVIEFPPVERFFALEDRVRIGDRVRIIALRNCTPPHQLRGQWIALPNGEIVIKQGRVQREVDGC
jgi:hypothetical protein